MLHKIRDKQRSDFKKAVEILTYGVQSSPSTEIWKICNTALLLLGGEGQGKLDEEFLEKILNKRK